MTYSPIALFVYKRPDHTRRALEALMHCPEFSESPLYVFCDGVKRSEDQAAVEQTRLVVKSLVEDRAKIVESSHNKGLANSIIAGVSQVVDQYGQVIVLEDDLVVSPVFLTYMNNALEKYRDENQVMQISGYMFSVPEFANRDDAMFLPFTVSWGWGTWQRAWQHFEPNIFEHEVLDIDSKMRRRFNLDGYFNNKGLLDLQILGQIDSWAIRWYWSFFKKDGLTLFPPVSYVKDCGRDGSGTHSSVIGNIIFKRLEDQSISTALVGYPESVSVNQHYYKTLKRNLFFYSLRNSIGVAKKKMKISRSKILRRLLDLLNF